MIRTTWPNEICGRRLEQAVAAAAPASALDEAVVLEIEQDLLEELLRQAMALGDVGDQQRLVVALLRQSQQGTEGVFRFLREHGTVFRGCIDHTPLILFGQQYLDLVS